MSSLNEALRSSDRAAPGQGTVDTRCIIVQMAERLFREIGYRKTTVADIAKALRMSPANVYRFFDSKRSINEAVAARMLDELGTELERIAAAPGIAPAQRLRDVLSTMCRMSAEQFTADKRMHEMVEAAMAESWDVVHRHIVRIEVIIASIVSQGAADGTFQVADPLTAARCVQSAMIRFCHPTLIVQCVDEPGPTIEQMCDFILSGLEASVQVRQKDDRSSVTSLVAQ